VEHDSRLGGAKETTLRRSVSGSAAQTIAVSQEVGAVQGAPSASP
jgi:hypothetical protein